MSTRITDSALYGHLWGTEETRAIFGEQGRLQGWLDVIAALARAQAAEGVIPPAAAGAITEHARAELIDLDYAARQTRGSSGVTCGGSRISCCPSRSRTGRPLWRGGRMARRAAR